METNQPTKVTLSLSLDEDVAEMLRQRATEQDRSISAQANRLLRSVLESPQG